MIYMPSKMRTEDLRGEAANYKHYVYGKTDDGFYFFSIKFAISPYTPLTHVESNPETFMLLAFGVALEDNSDRLKSSGFVKSNNNFKPISWKPIVQIS